MIMDKCIAIVAINIECKKKKKRKKETFNYAQGTHVHASSD
jgi:hypothetical protein